MSVETRSREVVLLNEEFKNRQTPEIISTPWGEFPTLDINDFLILKSSLTPNPALGANSPKQAEIWKAKLETYFDREGWDVPKKERGFFAAYCAFQFIEKDIPLRLHDKQPLPLLDPNGY
jgi:hypothetical protein